jgi:hypothetical protein
MTGDDVALAASKLSHGAGIAFIGVPAAAWWENIITDPFWRLR